MPSLVLALGLFVAIQAPQADREDPVARARAVIAALADGKFASVEAQFTDAMKAALPPGQLAARWANVVAQAGAFKNCATEARVDRPPDIEAVTTRCHFDRGELDLRVAFNTSGKLAGLAFRPPAAAAAPYAPPTYANPAAFREEELTIGGREWPLPATLTLPVGAGPFPAVVLVHGSGPNDRDETLGPNKPFKDLALGLASRGIAVLRYDKRSKAHGAKMAALPSITVKDEVLDDVAEAVKLLRSDDRIDRARIVVLGHSLGGMLVPRILAATPGLSGGVVLAGAARPLEDAIVAQTRYLAMADGAIAAAEQAQLDAAEKASAAVKGLRAGDPASVIAGVPSSYWLDLRGYDAPSAAAALKAPLLIVQGERDYQVTMAEFGRWKAALGSRPDVTFHSYPALNHLFMPGSGPSLPAEYDVASHVAEDVVRDVAAWIKR